MQLVAAEIARQEGKSGVHVLDTGTEALITRAWLVEQAQESIEVQYFIWSTDNIGILAAETLLRAAERGVKVRVIVDDLLINAPDKSLLALAHHPNIDIRIYNPKNSVGVTLARRAFNALTDFRGINQRMHDKTFIVDGKIAVAGGRNMAAEYYDYNHEFNFRDRDVLLLGSAVKTMQASFERFWESPLSARVEDLYNGLGLMQKNVSADSDEVQAIYRELGAYAQAPENFAPEVRQAITAAPAAFAEIARQIVWSRVEFISDMPGKNANTFSLDGGGLSTSALAEMAAQAQTRITIQSPYLVLSNEAIELFRGILARGVTVRINTNSLASTDNIQAFSGYRNQRKKLLKMGFEIFEYKPYPQVQQALMNRFEATKNKQLVFGLHAKTMVVDGARVYVGTYNFDPRSQNLNTEAGVIIHDESVARKVEAAIEVDMAPGNSWNAASDDPDRHVPLAKRSKVRLWQNLPIKPLL
ncbi:phospholipase D family protein [Noviherbaspirillum sedimenti]|uniref:Phospholipase D family protein n=2 Tax=Noviherbaspirillum sedimenti TaxID=2320865 RepID=A0A3A3G795_9BURK|nr:phospholipase D family protein [Noviherbaspirillum sedimenti]